MEKNFFSSPGCARELKLLPFVSESKTTSDCSNRFFSKKSPLKVTILPMHKILKRNNFRPFWIRWAYFWKVWRSFFSEVFLLIEISQIKNLVKKIRINYLSVSRTRASSRDHLWLKNFVSFRCSQSFVWQWSARGHTLIIFRFSLPHFPKLVYFV